MYNRKIVIKPEELFNLYWKNGMSTYRIADIFGCSFSTVTNRLKEYKIPLKNNSQARNRYAKKDFSNNKIEKAYILGFRIGDLNVYKTCEESEVVVARCHTTRIEQCIAIKKMFSKYGKVTVSKNGKSIHINCFLNKSFDFLLDKHCSLDEFTDRDEVFAFISGYIDAEGYIGINQNRARLKIDSYDEYVLKWISTKLDNLKIRNKLLIISVCSDNRNYGKPLWRVNVNYANDLFQLLIEIKKYSLHDKRLKQILSAENNIKERLVCKIK